MATAGLSTTVQLWDVRKVPSFKKNSSKLPKALAYQPARRSINSAYFSPSGKNLLTTPQSDKLEIIEDSHLASGLMKPRTSIKHNNQTGRWLSTLMAKCHFPSAFTNHELFVVGYEETSLHELFADNSDLMQEMSGEGLTTVASRCCFHPNSKKLIVVGGDSSGRVR